MASGATSGRGPPSPLQSPQLAGCVTPQAPGLGASADEDMPTLDDPPLDSSTTSSTGSTTSLQSDRQAALVDVTSRPPATMEKTANGATHDKMDETNEHRLQPAPDSLSEHQLSDYRQKLARDLSARFGHTPAGGSVSTTPTSRPSPIEEEKPSASVSPPMTSSGSSGGTATSTESIRTVRAAGADGAALPAPTPSYPFPRMAASRMAPSSPETPRSMPGSSSPHVSAEHAAAADSGARKPRPATARRDANFHLEHVLSSPATPASAVAFVPASACDKEGPNGSGDGNGNGRTPRPDHPSRRHGLSLPSPNLYELALTLTSEPGLDAWWGNVVQAATEWFKAERVSLIMPADATDVENMPWGQKATYNVYEEDDEMSLGYMGRGSSVVAEGMDPTPDGTPMRDLSAVASSLSPSEPPRRPSLATRYSYTAYEDHRQQKAAEPFDDSQPPQTPLRPRLPRTQTSQPPVRERSDIPRADLPSGRAPPRPYSNLNHAALQEHNAAENPQGSRRPMPVWDGSLHLHREARGRMLPVLQALDYEVDPLIDHNGVQRVLDRGRVVALTRSYPYMDSRSIEKDRKVRQHSFSETKHHAMMANGKRLRKEEKETPGKASPLRHVSGLPSSKHASSHAHPVKESASHATKLDASDVSRPRAALYEEYEQLAPSPWSQSPAPSPAVRPDPDESPFFQGATVDEDSFNPASSPEDYSDLQPPAAIGVDNAWTILHVPLFHPLHSDPCPAFRLDTTKMERRSSPRRRPDGDSSDDGPVAASTASTTQSPERPAKQPKKMPIAILSLLSPVLPYPSNLRHALEFLAPHIATSFSLALHYSNLEAEVAGLQRRRLDITGSGSLDTDGRPMTHFSSLANMPYLQSDDVAHRLTVGSMTSFSDYSGPSRSLAGSPGVTPGWDSAALTMFMDRRTTAGSGVSPSLASLAGDGYFGMRPSAMSLFGRPPTTPGGSSNGGGGGGGGTGHRARRSSQSHSDKRLPVLRPPDAAGQTRETTASRPNTATVPEASTEAPLLSAAPSPLPTEVWSVTSHPVQKGLTTGPFDMGADGSTQSAAEDGVPTGGLGDGPTAASSGIGRQGDVSALVSALPDDPPKPTADKDTSAAETAKSASGGQGHHRKPSRCRGRHKYSHSHSQLHSHGADFATTFPSLPPSATIAVKSVAGNDGTAGPALLAPSRAGSAASSSNPVDMPPPSDRLKGLILDSLPAHVFVAMPHTGAIVWVNSRYLAYRGQSVESLADDPWASIHPDDREEYLKTWGHSVRTGDQFSRTVRIRRFDGSYRWFQARAVASRDRRNSIVQFMGSYMDIHDQHIAELKAARQEEIEASEVKHRILANLIPQIIFTANEEEGITFANEQWFLYTGTDFEKVLGVGFMGFVHPDDLAKCSFLPVPEHLQKRRQRLLQGLSRGAPKGWSHHTGNGIAAPADGGGEAEEPGELAELARRGIIMVTTDDNGRPSYTTEVRLRSKTGEYRWHLVRCVETGTVDFGKGSKSYFGSATDINDHKLLETKLKDAMDSKTRFLSNMSHEIRTPLIGISGMVSFLQDTTLNEEQRDYTNTIQTSANSLLMIINDILDLSKVDAGMMKLSFEWFHTRSLIEDVNELVSTMAVAKGLELNYIVEADVPGWVKGDRVRIRQVLLNVIGNAIKFTTRGEVFSQCRMVGPAPSGNKIVLEFSVTDTGQGFTKEEAELIFKPFSQIDGSSTRQHGGSGLGLVISRQLVELHGGKMDGRAVPGEGSTFTFTALFGLPTDLDHPDGVSTPTSEAHGMANNAALTAMGMPTPFFMDTSAVVAAAAASATGASTALVARASDTVPVATSPPSLPSRIRTNSLTGALLRPPAVPHQLPLRPTASSSSSSSSSGDDAGSQTPVFSILIICLQTHSREATAKHIEMTLPKGMPHRITALATAAEAQTLLRSSERPELFTHVVINLPSAREIIELVDRVDRSTYLKSPTVLVLSDPMQRQAVHKLAAGTHYEELLSEARVTYVYKPVKPSRFAVIFDPAKERDLSIDHNRSTAQRLVETQKRSYLDLVERMGNKGYRVLLVEDNVVNQKVLMKYLHKAGVEVDVAADGVECTEKVLSQPHEHYALILCDLHMPRKDGYHACREIREWEAASGSMTQPIPIIALSANVMSDVHEKCVEAGFSKYITKPVDFVDLSRALSEFF